MKTILEPTIQQQIKKQYNITYCNSKKMKESKSQKTFNKFMNNLKLRTDLTEIMNSLFSHYTSDEINEFVNNKNNTVLSESQI